MKCEKSQQPKDNQNCGEYPKHILLLTSARKIIRDPVLTNCSGTSSCAGNQRADKTLTTWKAEGCPIVDTNAFLLHRRSFTRSPKPAGGDLGIDARNSADPRYVQSLCRLRVHLWQLFEIGLRGCHPDVRMSGWQTKKTRKNASTRPVPASERKWRSRAWPDPQK